MRSQADDLRVAHMLADAARSITRPYFRGSFLEAHSKSSVEYDPVTQADREAECVMREILALERPDDSILGEEFGMTEGTSGYTWVIDPIDGTRAFICGSPTWGVLVALNLGEKPHLGIFEQPFTQERFVGVAGEEAIWTRTTLRGDVRTQPLQTRACDGLENAILMTTFPEIGAEAERRAFERVRDVVKLTRYGLDCYAYGLLAMGQINLVIEAGLKPYDIQALIPIIETAGGIVTNWQGGPCHEGGQILAAGDAVTHQMAMALLV